MSSARVLVVDDHPINTELCVFLLQEEGFDIRTATDADEALGILREFAPDVMLIDLRLPGMDGLSLTEMLRGDPANDGLCIIVVTSYAMRSDEEKAYIAGCNGYLRKPISTREFGSYVRRCLNESQQLS
jgi:two-component system cell cycle response regulator DivK